MAVYVAYEANSVAGKALFNFDASGLHNFRYTGTVKVSVSDAFTFAQFLSLGLSWTVYSTPGSPAIGWTDAQLANVDLVTGIYSQFMGLGWSPAVNRTGQSPAAVGADSDINISWIYRPDWASAGSSAIDQDSFYGYNYARGDVLLNLAGVGPSGLNNNASLGPLTYGFHALMHEIGHSLGLAHPHTLIVSDVPVLSDDYAATTSLGFDKLGFRSASGADMDKEYFSIMSYDDQVPASGGDTFAQTPMILDVIALQEAYGEGRGSSGAADDTITPGASGQVAAYRTYLDVGGTDTIDLQNYATGAYLQMGTSIAGANHLVGVSMSAAEGQALRAQGTDPASLRWYFGEFERALGSAGNDWLVGNRLDNLIDGRDGIDTVVYDGPRSAYQVQTQRGANVLTATVVGQGTDNLLNVERIRFSDATLALDIAGHAGQAYRLYLAALGRTPDTAGLTFWTQALDAGMALADVAQAFLISPEFTAHMGVVLDHTQFLQMLYTQVLHRAGDEGGFNWWLRQLDSGAVTQAATLLGFSESAEHQAALVGVYQDGIVLLA